MKIALLVALCCLLSAEVKAVSVDVYSDAVDALTPSNCEAEVFFQDEISVITSI